MASRSESHYVRMGAIATALLALIMFASFNLQKLPGLRGTVYHAEFTDAAGLHTGSDVQVAGIRVGRVSNIRIGQERVIVDFDVKGRKIGQLSQASVEVKSLLGDKFLNVKPAGSRELPKDGTIPLSRTDSSYDIVGTLSQLTTQTEDTNKANLKEALDTLSETLETASPEIKGSFTGLARLSESIATRDEEIDELLRHSRNVTTLLDERKGDLVTLMDRADLVFQELDRRKDAIHTLLVSTEQLAVQLEGLVEDNQEQLRPTLDGLRSILVFLNAREDQLETTLRNYGPYVNILGNVIGTGPWFDALVPNMLSPLIPGEFDPVVAP
ncbi:MAG TPA: MCE family protein [Aeromicrobium sp.]|nr:MCE family protein [Aeromicrobium sp.]